MHPTLNIAVRAARAGGSVILRYLDRLNTLNVTSKGRNDFVSEVDLQAEQEIISVLRKAFPDHGILAEETGAAQANSDYTWIIDPLDGTTNYLHGFPQFSVSLALRHGAALEQAVVYDPLREELFTATRGGGAMLNNRKIRVSRQNDLKGALLGTGFPYREHGRLDTYLEIFREMIVATAGVRRPGSAALDLAYVAAGRLDGFWEMGLSQWDMAGGALLIQEAGGIVSDFGGRADFLSQGDVVAGNPKIHSALVSMIRPHLRGGQPG